MITGTVGHGRAVRYFVALGVVSVLCAVMSQSAAALSPPIAVSAGANHSCMLHSGGTISCWGNNYSGGLGNGTTSDSSMPVGVTGISDATQISAGGGHSCALHAGGTISCWGSNAYGGLGNGTTSDSSMPVGVTGISDATQISAGVSHSCALHAAGTISCWGPNYDGQLGDGTTNNISSTPVGVTGISDATQITAGDQHSCALRAGGTISCWGANLDGQLGDGTTSKSSTPVPVGVTGISDATQITAGGWHSCASRSGGRISCWGSNAYGQLGNGTTTSASSPVGVTGISDATQISANFEHSCALRSGGKISCWGSNGNGQLGNGTTTGSSTPVSVGENVDDYTTRYRIDMKAWIPQAAVVDPQQPIPASFVLAALIHRPCHIPSPVLIPYTTVTTQYRGDDHSGFEGSYRVISSVEFDWDGEQISNARVPTDPHFGTTILMGTYSNFRNITTCEIASKTVSQATNFSASGSSFAVTYSSANPLVPFSPAIDGNTTGSVAADGTILVHFATDLFPSHAVQVSKDGIAQRTDIVNDASCLPGWAVIGPTGAAIIGVGLSAQANKGDRAVRPNDANQTYRTNTALCVGR